jgi:predicted S18 family serine protease
MRLLILTLGLMALAVPAFANCGATHQASSSDTVATTSTPQPPPATPSSGG